MKSDALAQLTNNRAALNGSRHLEFLLDNNLINPTPSPDLGHIYSEHAEQKPEDDHIQELKKKKGSEKSNDVMLLKTSDGKELAKVLHAPELAAEVERAVEQVEKNSS